MPAVSKAATGLPDSDDATVGGRPRGRPCVLIVEDDPIVGLLLRQALVDRDWDVVGPVARLAEALEVARRDCFDAALLDVTLDDGTVYPLADVLAARGVRFAFMTGYGESEHPARYKGWPHLSKPYGPGALERLVEELIS